MSQNIVPVWPFGAFILLVLAFVGIGINNNVEKKQAGALSLPSTIPNQHGWGGGKTKNDPATEAQAMQLIAELPDPSAIRLAQSIKDGTTVIMLDAQPDAEGSVEPSSGCGKTGPTIHLSPDRVAAAVSTDGRARIVYEAAVVQMAHQALSAEELRQERCKGKERVEESPEDFCRFLWKWQREAHEASCLYANAHGVPDLWPHCAEAGKSGFPSALYQSFRGNPHEFPDGGCLEVFRLQVTAW